MRRNPTMAPDTTHNRAGAIVAKIADVLRREMEKQGMSFNGLAKKAELNHSAVHQILTGATPNPGILTIDAILAALGKSLAWLDRERKK